MLQSLEESYYHDYKKKPNKTKQDSKEFLLAV